MKLITKKDIIELNEVQKENCISIFIPTHRFLKTKTFLEK